MLASLFEELAAKKGVWKQLTNPVMTTQIVLPDMDFWIGSY